MCVRACIGANWCKKCNKVFLKLNLTNLKWIGAISEYNIILLAKTDYNITRRLTEIGDRVVYF